MSGSVLLCYYFFGFLEFQLSESEFRFVNFSIAEFKKDSDRNLWSQKRNRDSAFDGVPEIGTENWNSQPS